MKKIIYAVMTIVVFFSLVVNVCASENEVLEREVKEPIAELKLETTEVSENYEYSSVNDVVYITEGNKIVLKDKRSKSVDTIYQTEYKIEFAVPVQTKGLMVGSDMPLLPDGTVYDSPELATNLTWNGTYEYLDFETGEISNIENPCSFFVVARATYVELPNYTTTIWGKGVPIDGFEVGDIYDDEGFDGPFGSGYECHGFGLEIFDILFEENGRQDEYEMARTKDIKNTIDNLPIGTLLRLSYNGTYSNEHTVIIIGRSGTDLILYHANWFAYNEITITKHALSDFCETFPYLDFVIEPRCTHNVTTWLKYSTTQHRGICQNCKTSVFQKHFGKVAGITECLACGYYGQMDGGMRAIDN